MDRKQIRSAMLESGFPPNRGGCHAWMWVTDTFLRDGLWLLETLGFRYVRTLVWVKMSRLDDTTGTWAGNNRPKLGDLCRSVLQIGLGQYLRGSHELCLFGTMGNAMVPEPANRLPSVIFAERGKHSEKPDEAFKVFEQVSPGPRVEFFARSRRDGWGSWGNEVG